MCPSDSDKIQRISFDPDPPVQGGKLKICYAFDGSGVSATTLVVSFDDGSSAPYEVMTASPCVTIDVPSDATEIEVVDEDGPSPDKLAPVTPA